MARSVAGRLQIRGEIVARTALHVGGHGEDVDTDLPLAINGARQPYVPGTSLAGAMRAWCEAAFGEKPVAALWGYQKDDEGHASFVHIQDAKISNADALTVEIRDGVGIDRELGCAATHIKYDRAVLPRGARLELNMDVEYRAEQRDLAVAMFTELVRALRDGEVRLGAAKTRGLGKVVYEGQGPREHTLHSPEGMLELLRGRPGREVTAPPVPLLKRPRLAITVHWHPLGPLMVKAGADGVGVDSVPLVSGLDNRLALLLPGSSLKGAMRNHAERIVRTLLGTPVSQETNPRKRFLRHLAEVPLIEELFGAACTPTTDESSDSARDRLGLGAFSADDCHGQSTFKRGEWQAIVAANAEAEPNQPVSDLRAALDQVNLKDWTAAYHVAVDRWTGGAAESLLYTVLEPFGVDWEPMRLCLDLTRIQQDRGALAIMLVFLVLRDMAQGRLPLGFATQRGMGAIGIDRLVLSGRDLDGKLEHCMNYELPQGDVDQLPEEVRRELELAWSHWLDANVRAGGHP